MPSTTAAGASASVVRYAVLARLGLALTARYRDLVPCAASPPNRTPSSAAAGPVA
jgi:hypothetical protein